MSQKETRRNKTGNVENKCCNCGKWSMFGLSFGPSGAGPYFCPDCPDSDACRGETKKFKDGAQ